MKPVVKLNTIVSNKKIKETKYVLVKYKQWPDKFNEWLSEE